MPATVSLFIVSWLVFIVSLNVHICQLEQFSPAEVLSQVSIPQYIRFVIHSLEYKTLVIEQLSEVREKAALALYHKIQEERQDDIEGKEDMDEDEGGVDVSVGPYGVLLYTCVIRDLAGVGFEHVGAKGQEIIQAVIGVASANYPGNHYYHH